MDPEKLKVVDLRKELQERGLDTKGIKAVLVKRLKDALELNSESESIEKNDAPLNPQELDEQNDDFTEDVKSEILSGKVDTLKLEKNGQDTEEDAEISTENEKSLENEENLYIAEDQPQDKTIEEIKPENVDESKMESSDFNGEENLDNENDESSEVLETESRGEKRKLEDETENQLEAEHVEDKKRREDSSVKSSEELETEKPAKEKIPPKEDEPEIDYTKPQISWFDSDLHLKIDNRTFLSAKPLNEGCFGYVWAGARATHGISSGKVYFEAKITEELQWEDPADKMQDYRSQRYGRSDRRSHERHNEEEKRNDEKSEQIIAEKNEEQTVVEETENDDESKQSIENSEKVDDAEESQENVEKIQPLEPAAVPEIPAETPEETNTEIKTEESEESKEQQPEEQQSEESVEKAESVEKTEDKAEILPIPTHYFRVGFSMLGTSLQLGEDKFSYAYESTGKFITNKEFKEYGLSFSVGDIVGAYLSIVEEEVTLTFTLNGVVQPTAITVPRSEFPEGFSLFPHVLCRNYAYELNLGDKEPWVSNPDELKEYQLLSTIEEKIVGPQRPESREECEIILMIGLPGSGKTHWVKNYLSSNDKQYTVIGNTPLFDRMTVEGQPMKSRFRGSWKILVDRMQKCLNQLTDQACLRRRNYIIDQTNVFPSAQRRKLRSFDGFKRKAVIVVCDDDEHFRRQKDQQSDYGKSVPESTMYDLKAQMELPQKCDWLEQLIFTDLGEDEAKKKVREYNDEANKRGYFKRWQNDRRMMQRNYRQGYNRRSGYGNGGRYDRYPSGPGGWNRPAPSWGRRDMRGPPPPPYRYGPGGWRQPARGPPRSSDQNRQRDNRNSGFGGVRNQNASRNQSGNRNGGSWWSNNGGNSSYGNNHHHHQHHHQGNYYSAYGGYSGYGGWNQGNSAGQQQAATSSYGANHQNSYNSAQGQRGYATTQGGGSYSSSNQSAYGNSTQQSSYGGGQSNYANSQRGYGSQAAAANYGTQGNYGQQQQQQQQQNWNYYGQYSQQQQQQGWGTQQKRQ